MTILTAWTTLVGLSMAMVQTAESAVPVSGEPTAEQVGTGTLHGLTVNQFRLHAAGNIGAAVEKWGSAAFQAKWKQEVREVFNEKENIALQDFFNSAVVWVGGMKGMHAIVALYNPWADALLVLAQTVESGDAPKATLSDFFFISGESLRGVRVTPETSLSLHPLKEPLTVAIARLYAPSVERFTRLYPPEGSPVLLPDLLKDQMNSQVGELIMIKARLVTRLKMFQDYLDKENHDWLVQSGVLIRALKAGERTALQNFLSEKQSPAIIETICALNPEIRANFSPVYFSKAKDSVIMGLVNPAAPRWFIEATFLGEKPDRRIARVLLMDLETSAKALVLWGKEVPK